MSFASTPQSVRISIVCTPCSVRVWLALMGETRVEAVDRRGSVQAER